MSNTSEKNASDIWLQLGVETGVVTETIEGFTRSRYSVCTFNLLYIGRHMNMTARRAQELIKKSSVVPHSNLVVSNMTDDPNIVYAFRVSWLESAAKKISPTRIEQFLTSWVRDHGHTIPSLWAGQYSKEIEKGTLGSFQKASDQGIQTDG